MALPPLYASATGQFISSNIQGTPAFSWNIFSETMEAFLFDTAQSYSPDPVSVRRRHTPHPLRPC